MAHRSHTIAKALNHNTTTHISRAVLQAVLMARNLRKVRISI